MYVSFQGAIGFSLSSIQFKTQKWLNNKQASFHSLHTDIQTVKTWRETSGCLHVRNIQNSDTLRHGL